MKSFGSRPNGNFAKLKISQKKSATTLTYSPDRSRGKGGTTFKKGIGLSGHDFNPKRSVHGLVSETLSTAGGCASNLKAGLGNLGKNNKREGRDQLY